MSPASALLTRTPRPSGEEAPAQGAAAGAAAAAADEDARVYRGRSIDELIPRIEAELGADAIVIRRKKGLEGGIGGFFQRRFVEVEAKPGTPRFDMYDEGLGAPVLPPAPQPAPAAPRPVAAEPEPVVEDPPRPPDPPRAFQELTPDTFGAALDEAQAASMPDPFADELHMLDRGMEELQAVKPAVAPPAVAPPAVAPMPLTPMPLADPRHERARERIEQSMLEAGLSEELTAELIDAAIAHILPLAPRTSLAKIVHGAVTARIPRLPLLPARSATVAVVGPGGSGRTSCCAALLGAYRQAESLPASCATVMLVGEREEPAMLLSPRIVEPLTIASQRARQALAQAREEGLLLLDMPPLSPAEGPAIWQIADLLSELRPDRVVVALPATFGARAAAQLLEALRPLRASAMAITHADETDQLGVALEAACTFGLAPEYLLDRGGAGEGLTRIDPMRLADRLLP
jgi:flagellar biosynthesis protein FlhF